MVPPSRRAGSLDRRCGTAGRAPAASPRSSPAPGPRGGGAREMPASRSSGRGAWPATRRSRAARSSTPAGRPRTTRPPARHPRRAPPRRGRQRRSGPHRSGGRTRPWATRVRAPRGGRGGTATATGPRASRDGSRNERTPRRAIRARDDGCRGARRGPARPRAPHRRRATWPRPRSGAHRADRDDAGARARAA